MKEKHGFHIAILLLLVHHILYRHFNSEKVQQCMSEVWTEDFTSAVCTVIT